MVLRYLLIAAHGQYEGWVVAELKDSVEKIEDFGEG